MALLKNKNKINSIKKKKKKLRKKSRSSLENFEIENV